MPWKSGEKQLKQKTRKKVAVSITLAREKLGSTKRVTPSLITISHTYSQWCTSRIEKNNLQFLPF